jgi:hypothetical protein
VLGPVVLGITTEVSPFFAIGTSDDWEKTGRAVGEGRTLTSDRLPVESATRAASLASGRGCRSLFNREIIISV